ncbi:uncharacterized protein NMK_2811 [Novimethylophilus kurashikiensis]|uniref:Uncharacterized protein n=1 Tax=Novimethylophilus kurashikiensis TaxID=1825523 RepID=A0A2R5FCC4_9PROT|nr:hypothetical protein [Novimethylophilus kurashikiensis]GBG15208.1 uncharacterized protein NMK_2811 [Novimethylophilus kurashikiensis]
MKNLLWFLVGFALIAVLEVGCAASQTHEASKPLTHTVNESDWSKHHEEFLEWYSEK